MSADHDQELVSHTAVLEHALQGFGRGDLAGAEALLLG
jgi:hypothetical protein